LSSFNWKRFSAYQEDLFMIIHGLLWKSWMSKVMALSAIAMMSYAKGSHWSSYPFIHLI
jgi:hypothetical protein